ncbi:site-specific integrase [Magnetospirillum gryphiswaldense]|uniref:Site-specific recombinase, phage integrase family n=1 Tax=Magnetospirillum gryphiswaldense TaxID=55518 RepID=A4U3H6_9PROT|nr:hypothetical protein [Magnetospirillum gryphiswaldense]AVM75772.1 hypothetical protein MSR1_33070 [Magnetospirillum gryphiswaldense MSR-1]AVM79675.1 hypothetical protein MSR1L_33070 [Magnetospirillum gryphiswaldense]CAM77433.1 site-specific recombinase, phage integrase family [Magnetospirillum gryphiswaldense MSR-1]
MSEKAGEPMTLSATTIGKHVQHVKGFFNTARRHLNFTTSDAIDEMFDGIKLSKGVPSAQKRKSWPMEQLNLLFATPIWQGTGSRPEDFTKRHKEGAHIYRDAYWWLPITALWTGARLEELAQLHHEDLIADSSGFRFIHIHGEGERRVKTANSIRRVPVHSVLVGFGFLDLFDNKKAGQRIWPELRPTGRMKKLGDTYSTHFTDYPLLPKSYAALGPFRPAVGYCVRDLTIRWGWGTIYENTFKRSNEIELLHAFGCVCSWSRNLPKAKKADDDGLPLPALKAALCMVGGQCRSRRTPWTTTHNPPHSSHIPNAALPPPCVDRSLGMKGRAMPNFGAMGAPPTPSDMPTGQNGGPHSVAA